MADSPVLTDTRALPQAALLALFGGAMGIALAPIFVRLSTVGPSATAFWRLLLALPILSAGLLAEKRQDRQLVTPKGWRDYLRLGLAGLFFAGDMALWNWSIKYTTVANATLLVNWAPVFVVVVGWWLFGYTVSRLFLVGMVAALTGTAFLVGASLQLSMQNLMGDVCGLLAAVFYAGYLLAVKRLRRHFTTATVMTYSGAACAIALCLISYLTEPVLMPDSAYGWYVLLGLALVSQIGGQTMVAYALAHLPAAFSAVGLLLQPVAAAILAWLWLGESLSSLQISGGICVLVGIGIARKESA